MTRWIKTWREDCSDVEKWLRFFEHVQEKFMRLCGPLLLLLFLSLFSIVGYTVFCILIVQVASTDGVMDARVHRCLSVVLYGNLLFNYWMCMRTPPGTTANVEETVLYTYYGRGGWRFCKTCDLPKPDLAHHCSVCKKCILKMDHHCPWVNNCIGFRNYHHFYRLLFFTTVAAFYTFGVMFVHRRTFLRHRATEVLPMFAITLCGSVGTAVCGLLLWHTFLLITGQGTVDFVGNFENWKQARKNGREWRCPYNEGFVKNFKKTFDVDGRLWWLKWMLPTLRRKEGNGLYSTSNGGLNCL